MSTREHFTGFTKASGQPRVHFTRPKPVSRTSRVKFRSPSPDPSPERRRSRKKGSPRTKFIKHVFKKIRKHKYKNPDNKDLSEKALIFVGTAAFIYALYKFNNPTD
jgi:hypothetical protein